jgi:hypothetical protein
MRTVYLEDAEFVCSNWDFLSNDEKKNFLEYLARLSSRDFFYKVKEIIFREKDSFYLSRLIKIFIQKEVDLGEDFFRFVLQHPDARVRANALENISPSFFKKYEIIYLRKCTTFSRNS